MINYKRIVLILVFLFIILMNSNIILASDSPEEVNVSIDENRITVFGKLKESNTDVTIITYRSLDNSRIYIDQGKTDENGEFEFTFSLPNGTFYAVLNADGLQYTTEKIVAYKESEGEEEPGDINIDIIENKVTISGKINEKNQDISLIVYREGDNLRTYIDQGKSDYNGNFSFTFSLPNGTYYAVVNAEGTQYTTEEIVAFKESEDEEPEDVNVDINENMVTITGNINDKNKDISLIVYRKSDNCKIYIDQKSTDGSGNFTFAFALTNGTYFAVLNADGKQYITEEFIVYKAPEEEPEDIKIDINENKVTITGKLNEKNRDISLIVYRDDNFRVYVDQGKTDYNGEIYFTFTLPNGTYFVVLSTENKQYITDEFIVQYAKPIISAEISPTYETFDKNISKQKDVTTYIVWNDAEKVIDVKKGNTSIGADSYKLDNYKLTIKKEFLATQTKGDFVLTIEFDKGSEATFTINIVDSTSSGGSGGGSGGGTTPTPVPDTPIVLPTDIDGHWAKEYITELIEQGIISNYPDNTFRPDQNISRAEFVTIVVKVFSLESDELNVFNDTINHWAKNYISAAIENKIILGYGDNLFGPDDFITREQMAVIIAKAMKLNVEFSEMPFKDIDQISDWALNYVASATREKIINGYPDNTFKPKNNLTRAEAATIIYNILQK